MPFDYRIQPIGAWPGKPTPDYARTRSQFKTVETKVLSHLEREIRQLDGKQIVFRLQVREQDIRQDGMLRANARPSAPGVILEFTARRLKDSPRLLYRCDTFRNWWDNLSAVARALEALRMVDRYGVTPTGEQYAGFKALPASTSPTMTAEAAAVIVSLYHSGLTGRNVLESASDARAAIRAAIAKTHPDVSGDRAGYDNVDTARKVLSSHHGVSL